MTRPAQCFCLAAVTALVTVVASRLRDEDEENGKFRVDATRLGNREEGHANITMTAHVCKDPDEVAVCDALAATIQRISDCEARRVRIHVGCTSVSTCDPCSASDEHQQPETMIDEWRIKANIVLSRQVNLDSTAAMYGILPPGPGGTQRSDPYVLPPYNSRWAAFRYAYVRPWTRETPDGLATFWSKTSQLLRPATAAAADSGVNHGPNYYHPSHEPVNDAPLRVWLSFTMRLDGFRAMEHLAWQTFCGTTKHNDLDIKDRCTEMNGAPGDMFLECVWSAFHFLGALVQVHDKLRQEVVATGSFKVIASHFGGALDVTYGHLKTWEDGIKKHPLMNALGGGIPAGFEKTWNDICVVLEPFKWGDTGPHFFNDGSGARQGMWAFLHMASAPHVQESVIEQSMQDMSTRLGHVCKECGSSSVRFFDRLIAQFNPCKTCRRRYREDIVDIERQLQELDPNLLLYPDVKFWIYHNEVSLRVHTGMEQDKSRGCHDLKRGLDRCDWDGARFLHAALTDKFGTDKRWPAPEACELCWHPDRCEGADDYDLNCNDGRDSDLCQFKVKKFLSCFDIGRVRAYLQETYWPSFPGVAFIHLPVD